MVHSPPGEEAEEEGETKMREKQRTFLICRHQQGSKEKNEDEEKYLSLYWKVCKEC